MPDLLDLITFLGTAIVLAPMLLVALLGGSSLLGRPLSEQTSARAVASVTTFGLVATIVVFAFMLITGTRHVIVGAAELVRLENEHNQAPYHFATKFVFDRLSIPFVALTFTLLGTVGAFASRYMHREQGYNRFFVLYSLFLAGMVVAALAGTIETLFFGWELVGLSSALLVGFFQDRPAPSRNAFRVWVVYRVSDAALLTAAVFLHHMSGEGDFDKLSGYELVAGQEVAAWPNGVNRLTELQIWVVGGLLIVAAAGKSALIPFSGWLPRAMEGPTPSSALFYGALSVHLGAYLLLRMDPLLDASQELSILILVLGLLTSAFATLATRVQTDVKSALSFASLTQVGLIVAEIGLGWRYIPLIHLIGHASLRTLQFIRAPSVIRDHHTIENAIGQRLPRSSVGFFGLIGAWLYRFGLERGYLDAALERFIARPFLALFLALDRLEHRITRRLNNSSDTPPAKEQQTI
jgi:NADH-quinone oxidoreductase subunit L